ncbi:partitioning protein [Paraburkholderia hospita]|uniref:Partitioning protein n=1 Tax=Paraburkholderia hospita TaxID=169430 RepID=A0ABN0FMR5_9BURK|nr:AAA family ATPase [Paraburkholderia hospita]EIN00006.1 partitioning protein [Paraburkholderia hospita]OUL87797.1 plasmid partition protein A [Paraburkholderia hospita]
MTVNSELPVIDREVSLSSLVEFSDNLTALVSTLRSKILAPQPRKSAPTFTSTQVAEICEIDRARLHYLATKEGSSLPTGQVSPNGRTRQFTLAEARQWIQQVSKIKRSPLLETGVGQAKVIVSSNFKGGSCKTTTTMCLAQGLSLLGRKVLVVDLDPQASLTELCGLYAEKEIVQEDTVLPAILVPEDYSLVDVIQDTYWDGIDVIPAHPSLFEAEFHLPAKSSKNPGFKFWTLLRNGLEPVRKMYDYIILDSAPSLSYLTLNGLMAADAMVMPLVPESLDFISSASFWSLFADMGKTFTALDGEKKFDFVSVLLTKVDYNTSSSAPVVRSWVNRAYGDWLSSIEVPASSAMSSGALRISTVFDISKWDGSMKTLERVREPLDEYCRWLDNFYSEKWEVAQ